MGSHNALAGDPPVVTSNITPRASKRRRLRVLLLAELANPNWISVPMVGWRHIKAVSQFADVHVATHYRNREDIERSDFPKSDVTFIGPTSIENFVWGMAKKISSAGAMNGITQTAMSVPAYYQFENETWARFLPELEAGSFDLVHRITPVSPGVPSFLAKRAADLAVPFVLGPVNGGVPWPKGFAQERKREGEWLGRLRGAYRFLPYYRSVREHASAILVGSAAAWREMPREYEEKMFYLPENAIDDRQFSKTTKVYDANPLRVAFVGRMVACKGIEMLIKAAVPLLKEGKVVIDLIGDGPEKPMLLKLVESEGVAHAVRLDGWVPHTELQERLMQSAVLGFPSIREFGGGAVMEAMMLGLIPVVVGYGGPHEIVDSSCGFRVPLGKREDVIQGLRDTLTKLADMSGDERRKLGEAAHARINNEFSLPAKRDKTRAIYEWLVGIGEKPTHLRPPPEALELYKSPSFGGLF